MELAVAPRQINVNVEFFPMGQVTFSKFYREFEMPGWEMPLKYLFGVLGIRVECSFESLNEKIFYEQKYKLSDLELQIPKN